MARSSSKNSAPSVVSPRCRKRSDNSRTRSTTRPSRVEVERIIVPLAEIKTAGVIMAVRTASDEVKASMRFPRTLILTAHEDRGQFGVRRLDAAFRRAPTTQSYPKRGQAGALHIR